MKTNTVKSRRELYGRAGHSLSDCKTVYAKLTTTPFLSGCQGDVWTAVKKIFNHIICFDKILLGLRGKTHLSTYCFCTDRFDSHCDPVWSRKCSPSPSECSLTTPHTQVDQSWCRLVLMTWKEEKRINETCYYLVDSIQSPKSHTTVSTKIPSIVPLRSETFYNTVLSLTHETVVLFRLFDNANISLLFFLVGGKSRTPQMWGEHSTIELPVEWLPCRSTVL